MEINGSKIVRVYRGTHWAVRAPVRLFVTADGKIWIGYGVMPERFAHIANVGDRGTSGTGKDAILRAANA